MAAYKRRRSGLVHERSGGPTEWYTPPLIFEALGIEFDLDPCSPGPLVVPWIPARSHYTKAEDGLTRPWHGRVWMNPPYGPGIDRWLERFCEHRNGIALIFARTDTQWFHTYAARAEAVCFTRGRIPFVSPATLSDHCGGPGCGSVLLAYGNRCVEALRRSGLGLLIELCAAQPAGRRLHATRRSRRDAARTAQRQWEAGQGIV
ncbi:MAG: DNA N-6-adenine-methyltransferase [Candidatus Binatia bacterium]